MPKYYFKLLIGFILLFGKSYFAFSQNQDNLFYLVIEEKLKRDTILFNNYKQIVDYLNEESDRQKKSGYISSSYSAIKKVSDSIFETKFTKGKQISFVKIKNWDSIPSDIRKRLSLLKSKKKGTLPIDLLEKSLTNLNIELSNQGNPFNTIKLNDFSTNKDTLLASIKIENINPRTIDSIVIKGYEKFPKSFAKYYSGLKTGVLFRNQKTQEQTQLLNNLPFVNTFRPAEVLFNPNKTVLYLYLKKKNANNFDGFLGFSTEEESGRLVLDGYLNLNLINNLNFGEEISLTYKSDSEEQQQFRINSKLPYIFKLPLSLEAGLYIFRQKDEFSSTEQTIGFSYAFSPKIEALIGYKKIESADLNENENLVSFNQNFDATFLNSELRYTKRQSSLLFPTKTKAILSSEIGKRKQGNTSQFKVGLQIQQIFQLNRRNSIYIANNAQLFQSNNYLANELYRLGGILSIRGFEENSLRASLYNVLNTEYRFQLNETIYIHSIIDFAYIDNQTSRTINTIEAVGSDSLTSFGIGFGMLTKAGLFKLNYANGRSSNIPFEFGNSKVHISLTAYF